MATQTINGLTTSKRLLHLSEFFHTHGKDQPYGDDSLYFEKAILKADLGPIKKGSEVDIEYDIYSQEVTVKHVGGQVEYVFDVKLTASLEFSHEKPLEDEEEEAQPAKAARTK